MEDRSEQEERKNRRQLVQSDSVKQAVDYVTNVRVSKLTATISSIADATKRGQTLQELRCR
jgi:hypothetical protein